MRIQIGAQKSALSMLVVALLVLFGVGPANAADAGLSGGSTQSYTEGAAAIAALPGITITGGPFDGSYIDFEADPGGLNADNKEDLVLPEVANLAAVDTSTGAVSVYNGKVYLGDGSTYSQIGEINDTYDGLDGQKLRVDFSSSFSNAGFESVAAGATDYDEAGNTLTGWTARSGQIRLGTDSITIGGSSYVIPDPAGGYTTNYGKGCEPRTDDDVASSLTTWVEVVTGSETIYSTTINLYSEGSQSLQLRSSGSSSGGGDIVHGPVVWSDEFSAETGQTLFFDWAAAAGGDNYHILAGLLRTDATGWIEVLDKTGNSDRAVSDWQQASATVTTTGTYRFVFVSGTQDWTCYMGIGARLLIDNVRVVGSKALAGPVQTLARQLTYFSDGDAPASSQTIRVTAVPASGSSATIDSTITQTGVNDAPVVSGAVTVTEGEGDSISAATGTLTASDPDLDSPTLTYGISGETPSGATVSQVGNYGTLSVNTVTGAYTYIPNMAAIKPLNTGDDPTDVFTLTISDGTDQGTGSFTATIDSFTDTEPSAPTVAAVVPGDGFLTVLFEAPASSGGSAVSNYEYSTDGTNYVALSPSVTTGAIEISTESAAGRASLVNGTGYPITLKAVNSSAASLASNSVTGTPSGTPAINSPTIQSFAPGTSLTAVNNDFHISGFGPTDDLLVSIGLTGQASGTQFALTNFAVSGATEGAGYSSYSDGTSVDELAFKGTQSEVNAALQGLKIKTGSTSSDFSLNVSASVVSGSIVQSGATQSFYEYVASSGITWDAAKTAAEGRTFAGVSGYLVTITSAAENGFVRDRINGALNVWIGASDAEVEGEWRWATGPEGANGGELFWTGVAASSGGSEVTYASWSSGEPNNAGDEDAAVTNWGSATGTWNDLKATNSSSVTGYVVEYSEWGGEAFSSASVVSSSSQVSMGGPTLTATAAALSVNLSWSTPTRSGRTVSAYAVTSVPSVPGISACSGTATSCSVTGLGAGTQYTFVVTATWDDSVTTVSLPASTRALAASIARRGGGGGSTGGGGTESTPAPTPRVVPQPTQTPGLANGPVLRGNAPPVPTSAPTATVGGRPTTVTTRVTDPTNVNIRAGVLSLGVSVPSTQGEVTQGAGGATQVEVKKGTTAALSGTGGLPGSTVQVFLPLQGGNAKELARIPVDDTGSFSGDAAFSTRANEAPMPVGKQVLQIVSTNDEGFQTVVEMTVNIAQSVPEPEQNRSSGDVPQMAPGQSIATNAGVPTPVTVTPRPAQKQATVEGDGWAMAVDVPAAEGGVVETADGGALLELVRDEAAVVSGDGFMPGTRADVWLFSDPTLLGSVEIDAEGKFNGQVLLDSNVVITGEHTLQLQGVGEDGYVRAANLGVIVKDPTVAVATQEVAFGFLWWLWLLVGLLIVAVVTTVVMRTRRTSQ